MTGRQGLSSLIATRQAGQCELWLSHRFIQLLQNTWLLLHTTGCFT